MRPMETAPKDGRMINLHVEGTGGGVIPAKWMGSWWGFSRVTLGTPQGWTEYHK